MKIIVASDTGTGFREYEYPDDTSFEKDTPWHGWMRIIVGGKSCWFNTSFIVAILPSGD